MKVNVINRMFQYVIFLQVFIFIVFFIENINTLNAIELELPDGSTSTINVYALLGSVIVIMGVMVLASISFFGAGINSEGTRIMGKIVFMLFIEALLSLGTIYYFVHLGWLGNVLTIMFLLVFGLEGIVTLGGESEDD